MKCPPPASASTSPRPQCDSSTTRLWLLGIPGRCSSHHAPFLTTHLLIAHRSPLCTFPFCGHQRDPLVSAQQAGHTEGAVAVLLAFRDCMTGQLAWAPLTDATDLEGSVEAPIAVELRQKHNVGRG